MSLTPARPVGALICRGCLRARPLRLQTIAQRRWIGQKYFAKMRLAEEAWDVQAQEVREGKRKNLFDELDERGLIKDVVGSTKDHARELMRVRRVRAYAGIDPTAPSLHLGHLVTLMPLFWMYMFEYGAVTLIGGSTAKIGDPTGRIKDRPQITSAELVQNLAGIHHQLKALWLNVEHVGRRLGHEVVWASHRGIVNNNAWWNKKPLLEVMKRLGNHMRMGPMLGRDNVKERLQDTGLSFAEFAYPLMQGWDWYELYRQRGVQIQVGGSDQSSNLLLGVQCVKQCVESEPAPHQQLPRGEFDQPIGITVPLLTDASGAKIGKSAGNAVWFDPFKTSPFDFYGYLVRRADTEVERYLKLLTFCPLPRIADIMAQHKLQPQKRIAQHLLAYEVLSFVHGAAVANDTKAQHQAVYARTNTTVSIPLAPGDRAQDSATSAPQDPAQYIAPGQVSRTNYPRVDIQLPRHILEQSLPRIMFAAGLATSVGDADRSIKAGGIYVGGMPGGSGLKYQQGMNPEQLMFAPVKSWSLEHNKTFLIDDKILLIRKGKHNLRCIEIISEEQWLASGWTYPGQVNQGAFRRAIAKLDEKVRNVHNKNKDFRSDNERLNRDSLISSLTEGGPPLPERQLVRLQSKVREAEKVLGKTGFEW